MIVTLAELKAHLRILTNDEDTLLTTLIAQATTAASDYCRVDWTDVDEGSPCCSWHHISMNTVTAPTSPLMPR